MIAFRFWYTPRKIIQVTGTRLSNIPSNNDATLWGFFRWVQIDDPDGCKPIICYWTKQINGLWSPSSSMLTHLPRDKWPPFHRRHFKCIFTNEKFCILIRFSVKSVPNGPTDNKSALIQLKAWCRTGDKPLPGPMLPSSLTNICGIRGRWVNLSETTKYVKVWKMADVLQTTFANEFSRMKTIAFWFKFHYCDVIMGTMASQVTSLTIVYSGADQRKHQSSASQTFVRGIHRWLVNSPYKWAETRKKFPFEVFIMFTDVCFASKRWQRCFYDLYILNGI